MTPAAGMATRGGRAPSLKCGRPRRQGSKSPCGRGRGWGTIHPGFGACKLHGGSTPSGIKFAAREAAQAFARGMLGAEIHIEPGEAMEMSVRLATGQVTFYQLQVAALDPSEPVPETLVQGLERAILSQARIAKMALDAGVDDRRVKAIESFADRLIAAAEAGLAAMVAAGVVLTSEARTAFAREYSGRLSTLEAGEPDVDGEARAL